MKSEAQQFTFSISLSVLNHLGRHLYRSFVTILGEAISNAWDADAENVWIYLDKNKNSFIIKDDGVGMSESDFQDKFLNIGYSKRKDNTAKSLKGRPFIGQKGIGKLALLSCAEKITVVSKTKNSSYVGGSINNPDLDKAITDNVKPDDYKLEELKLDVFQKYLKGYDHGTLIYFENIKGGIKNTLDLLKKIIAMYFRFSLLDKTFNIFVEGEKITYKDLKSLAEKTEFLWNINNLDDPYTKKLLIPYLKEQETISVDGNINGFIASVGHYRDLNIMNFDEKVGIDLFVNGRLREKDILKHISQSRVVEDYLYGQIHFNCLDDGSSVDRFTSSREGVVPEDTEYQQFLEKVEENILKKVINDWDKWRRKHREDGDSENKSITPKDRKSGELFNAIAKEYILPSDSLNKKKVAGWVNDLADDAQYNFGSYGECFVSENLIREYIQDKKISLSPEAKTEAEKWKQVEKNNKNKGGLSIDIRRKNSDAGYLSMDYLANLVDKKDPLKEACLTRDANEYKPIRDAIAHTSLLTDTAKKRLSAVYENIKGRVKDLLS